MLVRQSGTSMYHYKVGGLKFRVRKIVRGSWDAQVRSRGRWTNVIYPQYNVAVLCSTRREMVAYLRYAYEGKEPATA